MATDETTIGDYVSAELVEMEEGKDDSKPEVQDKEEEEKRCDD